MCGWRVGVAGVYVCGWSVGAWLVCRCVAGV